MSQLAHAHFFLHSMASLAVLRGAAALCLALLLSGTAAIEILGEERLNGFAFTNGRNSLLYTTEDAVQSLENMAYTGANMVHVM